MTEIPVGNLPEEAVELYLRAVREGSLPTTGAPAAGPSAAGSAPGSVSVDPAAQCSAAIGAAPEHVALLCRLGLLQPGVERDGLIPVDPETAAAQQERDATAALAAAVKLRADLAPLAMMWREAQGWRDGGTLVRYVRGKESVGQELNLVFGRPNLRRVRTMQPGGPRPGQLLKAATAAELSMISRDIQREILYQDRQRDHEATASFVAAVTKAGAQVRTLPDLPQDRIFLIDDDLVVYPKDGDNEVAVFNREPSVVALMNRLFEGLWDRAEVFGPPEPDERAQQLTADQRYAARLQVSGKTVEAIANEMGWSVRTTNRHLSAVREAYGAKSPAELAWVLRGVYPKGFPAEW